MSEQPPPGYVRLTPKTLLAMFPEATGLYEYDDLERRCRDSGIYVPADADDDAEASAS